MTATPSDNHLGSHTQADINDIPRALRALFSQKSFRTSIQRTAEAIQKAGCEMIYIFGSGASHHAGVVASYWFSQISRILAHSELAPEFPHLIGSNISPKHVAICISQSGESELTVYAARKARDQGALVVVITNESDSALAKLAPDHALLTHAGREQSLLATKTYISQLVALLALALEVALLRHSISLEIYDSYWQEIAGLPNQIEVYIPLIQPEIRRIAPIFKFCRKSFVIGSGPDYGNCKEAALILIEGAQIFAQAFSTAETLHGPMTLLSDRREVFILCFTPHPEAQNRAVEMVKLTERMRKSGATLLRIGSPAGILNAEDLALDVPDCSELVLPVLAFIPAMLFVVETARVQNVDCDKPPLLAKVSKL